MGSKAQSPVEASPAPPAGNVYRNESLGCTLEAPEGWSMKTDLEGRLVVFSHPQGLAQGELFHETLSVPTTSRDFGMAMHKRLAGSHKSLGKDRTYGKHRAYVSSYVISRGSEKLRYRLYSLVNGSNAFVITCVAPASTYKDFQDTFEEIFTNFKVE